MNLFKSNISSATQHLALALLASFAMVSCGGGGDSSPSGGNVLSGTAATGAPIASGTVTIKDSAGATATTITDANGNYSFDVGAMRFPLMLKVQPNTPGAAPLFSAGLSNGTANTTPLTNLEVFEATGRSNPADIYNTGDFSKIGKSTLDYGKITVTSNFATRFAANGLDLTTHDPITTPMVANGVGMDAILDQTNVAVIGNRVSLTDAQGRCTPYGGGLTLGIDGIAPEYALSFIGINTGTYLWSNVFEGYVQNALDSVCVAGTPVPDGSAVTDGHSESYYRVVWTRDPTTYTREAVDALKVSLRLATNRQRLPINIVAHSWGTVIAYIALTELATETPSVKVATLITLGSPIQCLSGGCISSGVIQTIVPQFIGQSISKPSNVTTWENFWSVGDVISADIPVLNNDSQPLTDACTTPVALVDLVAGSAAALSYAKGCHTVYHQPQGTPGSVLTQISSLLFSSQANVSYAPIITPPPVSTAPAVLPSAFTLSAGGPYCDLSNPPGPAVNLTWTASDGNVNYRVFRNGSAIGVNLVASQFSFQNNLGLVAGQTYSYTVQAMNVNGATWSNAVQVTIPANVCVTAPPTCTAPQVLTNGVCVTPTTNTFSISGNAGLSGVTMTLSGASSGGATTDANGNYTFGNLANGSYTVAPALSGYSFTPSSLVITVNGANITAANFTATSQSGTLYSITGTVTASGYALSGVTMTLSGANSGAYTTGANGMYGFALLANGSYTVTPALSGYTFTPTSSPITISGANIMGANFTGSAPNTLTAPAVQSLAATSVTSTSAQLNASVNPQGSSTTTYFEYGTTTSYGSTTGVGGSFSGTSAAAVNYSMSGLPPNTTYHYRVVATNSGGTSRGGDVTFTTVAATIAPTVQSLAATLVTSTTAQMNGSINPNGLSTSAYFEYGTTTGYGSSTGSGTFSGTSAITINSGMAGLISNTTYHYRAVATNSGGTSRGGDVTFTTTATQLVVNGVASSYIGTGQKTIPLTGSGFNSLSQISWSCTNPNGTICAGSPYVWTPGTAKWSNVTITSDTVATVYPTFLIATDPAGTYNWSVTFSGGGQSVTKYFTAIK